MKILVTGGCGFIGSHIVDAYIEQGYEVVVADLVNKRKASHVNTSAKYIQINLTDSAAVKNLIKSENPDCINHHAANISLSKSIEEPLFDSSNNITAIINILESMKKFEIPKIIFASSAGAIYSESSKIPFSELSPEKPISPYGVSKLASEKYIQVYAKLYGISYSILRYSNVYGPRQNTKLQPVIATFITSLLLNKEVTIFNDGKQTRDFVFVDDLKSANLLATMYPRSDTFNISSNTETTILEILQQLETITKRKSAVKFQLKEVKEQPRSYISNKKAYKKLGWKPMTELKIGLKQTLNWYEKTK